MKCLAGGWWPKRTAGGQSAAFSRAKSGPKIIILGGNIWRFCDFSARPGTSVERHYGRNNAAQRPTAKGEAAEGVEGGGPGMTGIPRGSLPGQCQGKSRRGPIASIRSTRIGPSKISRRPCRHWSGLVGHSTRRQSFFAMQRHQHSHNVRREQKGREMDSLSQDCSQMRVCRIVFKIPQSFLLKLPRIQH